MGRIERRPEAESDLEEIYLYLARRSVRAADRFLTAAQRAFETLASMPEIGGLCESRHPRLQGLRLWTIKKFRKYVILYRALADGVEIKRVVHGARNIENLFEPK